MPQSPKYGVIDLGTNTFHLLIVAPRADGSFEELFRHRIFIKLAEAGIHTIGEAPFQRGLDALVFFKERLEHFEVQAVKAFGTAGLRTASNSQDFIQQARALTGLDIEIISGEEEARLIHLGATRAVPPQAGPSLIMDIGGGSVEFILAQKGQILWAQSFPIGVAILFQRFHHSDPIAPAEIEATEAFIHQTLEPLRQTLQQQPPPTLIGASGTFDVLENILAPNKTTPLYAQIPADRFPVFYQQLRNSTLAERLAMQEVPDTRADMIIVALILINYILRIARIKTILVSAYAMKEGMLTELIQSDQHPKTK
ncbi:MAG: exopolyphosphatase [Bacteroidota bacterium]